MSWEKGPGAHAQSDKRITVDNRIPAYLVRSYPYGKW